MVIKCLSNVKFKEMDSKPLMFILPTEHLAKLNLILHLDFEGTVSDTFLAIFRCGQFAITNFTATAMPWLRLVLI